MEMPDSVEIEHHIVEQEREQVQHIMEHIIDYTQTKRQRSNVPVIAIYIQQVEVAMEIKHYNIQSD